MGEYIAVLLPSIGVGLIFWFIMRALFRADRGERRAQEAVNRDQADAEKWYQDLKARESGARGSVGSASDEDQDAPRR